MSWLEIKSSWWDMLPDCIVWPYLYLPALLSNSNTRSHSTAFPSACPTLTPHSPVQILRETYCILLWFPKSDSQTRGILGLSISHQRFQRNGGAKEGQAIGKNREEKAETRGARGYGVGQNHRTQELEVRWTRMLTRPVQCSAVFLWMYRAMKFGLLSSIILILII